VNPMTAASEGRRPRYAVEGNGYSTAGRITRGGRGRADIPLDEFWCRWCGIGTTGGKGRRDDRGPTEGALVVLDAKGAA